MEGNGFEFDFDFLIFEGEEDLDLNDQTDFFSDNLGELSSSEKPNEYKEIADDILDFPKLI